jgi:hypothetical protein
MTRTAHLEHDHIAYGEIAITHNFYLANSGAIRRMCGICECMSGNRRSRPTRNAQNQFLRNHASVTGFARRNSYRCKFDVPDSMNSVADFSIWSLAIRFPRLPQQPVERLASLAPNCRSSLPANLSSTAAWSRSCLTGN